MKFTFNIECSPEEARQFMGLPDMQPMQEALMKNVEQRVLAVFDPQAMARMWVPAGVPAAEQMQKLFWSQMQQTMTNVANVTGMICGVGDQKVTK